MHESYFFCEHIAGRETFRSAYFTRHSRTLIADFILAETLLNPRRKSRKAFAAILTHSKSSEHFIGE